MTTAGTAAIGTRRRTTHAAPPQRAGDWRAQGACRDHDPELFFPIGTTGPAAAQIEEAKAVCNRSCPVRTACLEWALETRQDAGVWGGLSEDDRRRVLRRQTRRYGQRHGTVAQHIVASRLPEFLAAQSRGLSTWQIAQEMETNVQTVNKVLDALEKDGHGQALDVASDRVGVAS